MTSNTIDRKIAVVLVADVVGYSKHMEKNEEATLASYSECEKIFKILFKKYSGSIFNTAGDSVLVEFDSAVNALNCAVDFQNKINKRNKSIEAAVQLKFRLGINIGDVIKKEGNLLGDGVNIAARLEALAQPGGISISKSVYDLVVSKTKLNFNDLGVQKVKQNEFYAYDVLLEGSYKRSLKPKTRNKFYKILSFLVILIALTISYLFLLNDNNNQTIDISDKISSKPKILVLPIKASGASDEQSGLVRGITESMISTLAQYNGIIVLTSGTSFFADENNISETVIKEDYDVDYLIRGTLQLLGDDARINLQISDLNKSVVSMSKKKDFKFSELFKVQDQLSNEILNELQINFGIGAGMRGWAENYKNIEEFTQFLNWRNEWRKFTKTSYLKSNEMLLIMKKNLAPDNSFLHMMTSWQLMQKVILKLSTDEDSDLKKIENALQKAIEYGPNVSGSFSSRAYIGKLLLGRNCEESTKDIDKALELEPNSGNTLQVAAAVYAQCSNFDKAISAANSSLEITPNDTNWMITGQLASYYFQIDEIELLTKLIGENINAKDMDGRVLAYFSLIESRKGNKQLAKKYLMRAIENGLTKGRLEANLVDEKLRDSTIQELSAIVDFQ